MAVPSRLYYQSDKSKPLNGKRISVKDNFHLKGIVTTLGSRAYTECYGPQQNTSELIKQLVDLGAVIVGKTKMGAFAGSEIPPEKCIDYFPPWNPRADGYQGPSGSYSGAAASVAGYSWLDYALATDSEFGPGEMDHPGRLTASQLLVVCACQHPLTEHGDYVSVGALCQWKELCLKLGTTVPLFSSSSSTPFIDVSPGVLIPLDSWVAMQQASGFWSNQCKPYSPLSPS